jgi:hypothetical protein
MSIRRTAVSTRCKRSTSWLKQMLSGRLMPPMLLICASTSSRFRSGGSFACGGNLGGGKAEQADVRERVREGLAASTSLARARTRACTHLEVLRLPEHDLLAREPAATARLLGLHVEDGLEHELGLHGAIREVCVRVQPKDLGVVNER